MTQGADGEGDESGSGGYSTSAPPHTCGRAPTAQRRCPAPWKQEGGRRPGTHMEMMPSGSSFVTPLEPRSRSRGCPTLACHLRQVPVYESASSRPRHVAVTQPLCWQESRDDDKAGRHSPTSCNGSCVPRRVALEDRSSGGAVAGERAHAVRVALRPSHALQRAAIGTECDDHATLPSKRAVHHEQGRQRVE